MSSAGFHVHGPHDHQIEHATQAGHAGHGADAVGALVGALALLHY